ncbi:hypothetical protein SE86_04700 [Acidilobus sp. 7A]|nr:hypothetical protein SE86_04700 [Acidilobus sp. 7A]
MRGPANEGSPPLKFKWEPVDRADYDRYAGGLTLTAMVGALSRQLARAKGINRTSRGSRTPCGGRLGAPQRALSTSQP